MSADNSTAPRPFLRPCCFLALAAFAVMTLFFLRAGDLIWTPFGRRPFDAAVWRNVAPKDRSNRAEMAGDLINNRLRGAMTDVQVTALLGPPNKTWRADYYTPPQPHDVFEYDMGQAPYDLAGQHYVLRLSFDRTGHYARPEVTKD